MVTNVFRLFKIALTDETFDANEKLIGIYIADLIVKSKLQPEEPNEQNHQAQQQKKK